MLPQGLLGIPYGPALPLQSGTRFYRNSINFHWLKLGSFSESPGIDSHLCSILEIAKSFMFSKEQNIYLIFQNTCFCSAFNIEEQKLKQIKINWIYKDEISLFQWINENNAPKTQMFNQINKSSAKLNEGHQREAVLLLFNKNEKLNHMSKIKMLYVCAREKDPFKRGLCGEEFRKRIRWCPRQDNT